MKLISNLFICATLFISFLAHSEELIISKYITVEATNDVWTQTNIKVSSGDILLLEEQGNQIVLGAWLGAVTANGLPSGEGALERKIATGAAVRVGTRYFETVENSCLLKLKIADKKYEDNKGHFIVKVTLIPARLIHAAE